MSKIKKKYLIVDSDNENNKNVKNIENIQNVKKIIHVISNEHQMNPLLKNNCKNFLYFKNKKIYVNGALNMDSFKETQSKILNNDLLLDVLINESNKCIKVLNSIKINEKFTIVFSYDEFLNCVTNRFLSDYDLFQKFLEIKNSNSISLVEAGTNNEIKNLNFYKKESSIIYSTERMFPNVKSKLFFSNINKTDTCYNEIKFYKFPNLPLKEIHLNKGSSSITVSIKEIEFYVDTKLNDYIPIGLMLLKYDFPRFYSNSNDLLSGFMMQSELLTYNYYSKQLYLKGYSKNIIKTNEIVRINYIRHAFNLRKKVIIAIFAMNISLIIKK